MYYEIVSDRYGILVHAQLWLLVLHIPNVLQWYIRWHSKWLPYCDADSHTSVSQCLDTSVLIKIYPLAYFLFAFCACRNESVLPQIIPCKITPPSVEMKCINATKPYFCRATFLFNMWIEIPFFQRANYLLPVPLQRLSVYIIDG